MTILAKIEPTKPENNKHRGQLICYFPYILNYEESLMSKKDLLEHLKKKYPNSSFNFSLLIE